MIIWFYSRLYWFFEFELEPFLYGSGSLYWIATPYPVTFQPFFSSGKNPMTGENQGFRGLAFPGFPTGRGLPHSTPVNSPKLQAGFHLGCIYIFSLFFGGATHVPTESPRFWLVVVILEESSHSLYRFRSGIILRIHSYRLQWIFMCSFAWVF